MLKFTVVHPDDRLGLFLGLTQENLRRLPTDQPIVIKVRELVPPGMASLIDEVVIFAGKDEKSMIAQLQEAGLEIPEVIARAASRPERSP